MRDEKPDAPVPDPFPRKWGIDLQAVKCPQCGTPAPTFRVPRNLRQLLWGGWICAACNCESDKCGRKTDR